MLRVINGDPSRRQKSDDLNTIEMYHKTETMKIRKGGNNMPTINSLIATINELDAEINAIGMENRGEILENENDELASNSIYPSLDDIEFDTTYENDEKKRITENNNYDQLKIHKKSRTTRRYHKPNLESTRKSMKEESLDKMNSTQSEAISKIPFIDSSPIHEEKSSQSDHQTSNIPDEVKIFLQVALGNESYNSIKTNADTNNTTNLNISVNEVMPEIRTPFYRKIGKLLHHHEILMKDELIKLPTKSSETLDRTAKFYRSLSQRVKKKIRATMNKQEPEKENNSFVTSQLCYDSIDSVQGEIISKLLHQVRIQQSIINQATKALKMCQSNKEFMGSLEEVESQRILAIANLRKHKMIAELKNLSSPDQPKVVIKTENTPPSYVDVHISNIQLTLRKGLHEKPGPGEIHEWFLVVVSENMNVWASHTVPCPINNLTIDFEGFNCEIKNLTPKLKITLEVYVLKLVTGVTYDHDQKYHISKIKVESRTCPSPTKFFKKVEHPLSTRTRLPVLLTSSFVPSGYVELFLSDLVLVSPWPLSAVPSNSMLLGTIAFKLNSTLHLSISHQGFLNYCDESGGSAIWNRRWCVLKGQTLMFWNYPREQENMYPPLLTIDLVNCSSKKIAQVNRTLCAKPRTLLIETVRPRTKTDRDSLMVECRHDYTITRHLLSCDSIRELVDWISKLDHVLSILRTWNVNAAYWNPSMTPTGIPIVSEL